MSCISYDKIWRSQFHSDVSAEDRLQDMNRNQLKLKVNDTYKKDEKQTTSFEPSKDVDVVSKAYPHNKFPEVSGHISIIF